MAERNQSSGQAAAPAQSAEEALRASEAKFATAFGHSPLALTITSLVTGRLIEVNEAFVRLSGYSREEAIGRTPDELGLWVKPDTRAERFARLKAGDRVPNVEARFRMKSGEELVGVIASAVVEINSELCVLSSVADVTDRRRAEDAVRESHAVLDAALDAGRLGAWDWDIARNTVSWTDRLYEFYGLERGSFGGTLEDFARLVHPDDLPLVREALDRTLQQRSSYELEFRAIRPDGETRWLFTRAEVFSDDAGTPVRMIGIAQDITERKRTEDVLRAAHEAAEQASRLKDDFLATLSHELRTPLNAILGYARMLRTGAIHADKRERALEVIERNAIAQSQLIEDLLDVSRITSGKVRLNVQPVAAEAALREAIDSVRPAADAKRLSLDVDLDPAAGLVNADPTRLQQVFGNILSNAIKFTGEGGRIAVRLERRAGVVTAIVRDTGAGIAPAFLPYIFDAFRQADGRVVREHGGLGLGLAISKHIVELHGGSIAASSDGPGQGATFIVRLPAQGGQPPFPS